MGGQLPDDISGWTPDEVPGTLAYFTAFRNHLESQLVYPDDLPAVWTETLQCYQAAKSSLQQAQKLLDELQKDPNTPPEEIDQATKAVNQATSFLQETSETVHVIGESFLTTTNHYITQGKDPAPSIPAFLSPDFDDSTWATFMVLQNPQQWADWCCPSDDKNNPDPKRVALAMNFLLSVDSQRRILGEGGGGPRHGNYGGYLEILQKLDSSSAYKEPVLERLAQAVALEFADGDYCYFDTTDPIDPVSRYIHYEQAYLMGDLDPAFSTFSIWELRCAVNSPVQDWELQWGRECLQAYRPDWIFTDDEQWRYCRLVRLDVGYMDPTFTTYPRTMDQILSGGGKCGPRAWFGRFMCRSFGIPVWGVRQPGHAAMSRWTPNGWMVCLGAGFEYSWWEDRGGLDFQLETVVRDLLAPSEYVQQVMRLEWLANYKKETNQSIRKDFSYDPAAPWYTLGLVQRQRLAKTDRARARSHPGRRTKYPVSTRTIPRILRARAALPSRPDVPVYYKGGICIPADATTTVPDNNLLVMPCFTGGHQIFVSADTVVDYTLQDRWLPSVASKYRLSVKVATAHSKETVLLVKVGSTRGKTNEESDDEAADCYRLPLPYTKGLWCETESIEIELAPHRNFLSLQREWTQYGISLKEIRLEACR